MGQSCCSLMCCVTVSYLCVMFQLLVAHRRQHLRLCGAGKMYSCSLRTRKVNSFSVGGSLHCYSGEWLFSRQWPSSALLRILGEWLTFLLTVFFCVALRNSGSCLFWSWTACCCLLHCVVDRCSMTAAARKDVASSGPLLASSSRSMKARLTTAFPTTR